jgi:hypothetical protein
LTSGTHLRYAKAYLKPEQIDSVDIEQYMNWTARSIWGANKDLIVIVVKLN